MKKKTQVPCFKVLTWDWKKRGMEFKLGENTDIVPFDANVNDDCAPGGLYYARGHISDFYNYGEWLALVKPSGRRLEFEFKGRAHKLTILKAQLLTPRLFRQMVNVDGIVFHKAIHNEANRLIYNTLSWVEALKKAGDGNCADLNFCAGHFTALFDRGTYAWDKHWRSRWVSLIGQLCGEDDQILVMLTTLVNVLHSVQVCLQEYGFSQKQTKLLNAHCKAVMVECINSVLPSSQETGNLLNLFNVYARLEHQLRYSSFEGTPFFSGFMRKLEDRIVFLLKSAVACGDAKQVSFVRHQLIAFKQNSGTRKARITKRLFRLFPAFKIQPNETEALEADILVPKKELDHSMTQFACNAIPSGPRCLSWYSLISDYLREGTDQQDTDVPDLLKP